MSVKAKSDFEIKPTVLTIQTIETTYSFIMAIINSRSHITVQSTIELITPHIIGFIIPTLNISGFPYKHMYERMYDF